MRVHSEQTTRILEAVELASQVNFGEEPTFGARNHAHPENQHLATHIEGFQKALRMPRLAFSAQTLFACQMSSPGSPSCLSCRHARVWSPQSP